MPVVVALAQARVPKLVLKRLRGLAQVVQQGGECGQGGHQWQVVPSVFVARAQYVAGRGVGGHRALVVELTGITHHPQQLAVVAAANPVAGHGGVLAGRLAQQLAHGIEPDLGDGCLPGALAAAFGKLVQDAAGFRQCAFGALRDEQHIHAAPSVPEAVAGARSGVASRAVSACCASRAVSMAMALSWSMMKSSASLRVKASMH